MVITPDDVKPLPNGKDHYEELIPKWRTLSVFEGERVEKGEVISDGPPTPHDILRLKGIKCSLTVKQTKCPTTRLTAIVNLFLRCTALKVS